MLTPLPGSDLAGQCTRRARACNSAWRELKRGNLTRKTAPFAPFRLSISIWPLCASTMVRTMERPMPIPWSLVE